MASPTLSRSAAISSSRSGMRSLPRMLMQGMSMISTTTPYATTIVTTSGIALDSEGTGDKEVLADERGVTCDVDRDPERPERA